MTLHQAIMIFTFVFGVLFLGLANGNSLSRIIGGSPATLSDHPHQVSLQYRGSHSCGGSIVAEQWILTAAHCVDSRDASDLQISLNNGNLTGSRTIYNVQNVIMHKDYDNGAGAYPNDIALLYMNQPMDLEQFGHSAITLATPGQVFDELNCVISGWGYTKGNDHTSIPDILQETSGVIMTSVQCGSKWGSNYNHNVHICIDDRRSGSCSGDSGGPMVCLVENNEVLAGVTSWGYSGCRTDFPSVYARVSTYYDWIMSYIQ